MGIEWPKSADKHSIPHGDALYAMQNAIYTSERVKVNDGDSLTCGGSSSARNTHKPIG